MNPYKLSRKALNYTQKDLAEYCSVTTQVVTRSEQGMYNPPIRALTRGIAWLLHQHPSLIPEELYHHDKITATQWLSAARLSGYGEIEQVDALCIVLEKAYNQWIKEQRAAFASVNVNKTFRRLGEYGVRWGALESEWQYIKIGLSPKGSVAGAAVAMCYQISLLQEFEKLGRGSDSIKAVLEEMGYEFE